MYVTISCPLLQLPHLHLMSETTVACLLSLRGLLSNLLSQQALEHGLRTAWTPHLYAAWTPHLYAACICLYSQATQCQRKGNTHMSV